MNGRAFFFLLIAIPAGLSLVGCATQPTTTAAVQPPDVRQLIVGKPQIMLPGARVAEVKAIALGAAHSKGWTLVEETTDKVILQRPMDPTSPQAVALGAAGGPAPIVQVTTYFVAEPGGVIVALDSQIPTATPDQTNKAVDYTEAYRADLARSLQSLSESWAANRERVDAALRGTRSAAQSPEIPYPYGDPNADLADVPSDPLKAAWAAATTLVGDQATGSTAASQASAAPATQSSPETSPRPSASPSGGAPVVDMNAATAWGTSTAAARTTSGADMAAPAPRPRTGMWAYYAEQFAITRGCALTDQGAVIVEQRPDAEILDVPCQNLPTFRLRCHNGVCSNLG